MPDAALLRDARRIVVKVGSSLVTNEGRGLDAAAIGDWCRQLAALAGAGRELIMVSSGAIAEGMKRLGWRTRPHELPELQAAAVPGRVTWAGFVDEQATVSAVYRNADVLVLPSDYEPWALVVNEAVAAGLAVVASDVVGAAAELVRDGVNGRLFPPGDLARLTAALRDVTDPANVDRMRAASAGVLADWRRRGDPVDGLRAAMRSAGVL